MGINATRLYTLKYGQNKQVLSVGRVQTPTLSMVVNRYLDISNFKPQPYWELVTVYKNTKFSHNNGRFLNKESGQLIANKIESYNFKSEKQKIKKIAEISGLDTLQYISIEGMKSIYRNDKVNFCDACFTGKYNELF